jgi:hypothetical protein
MVADDDLGIKAGSLNRFFKTFRDYRLTLAQPSVCPYVKSSLNLFILC